MPVNLGKAKSAIETYRQEHGLLHQNPPEQLSEAHNPLTDAMRVGTQKWGFSHEDDVFEASDMEVLQGMGYSSRAEFLSTVYDAEGNVNSGYENDHNTWEARWK